MNRLISHRAASTSLTVARPAAAAVSLRARRRAPASLPPTIRSPSSPALTPLRRCTCRSSSSSNDPSPSSSSPPSSAPSSPSAPPAETLSEDVWARKPLWCRPYSIVATGLFVVGGAEVVGGRWLALAAASAVLVWWWAFLVEYPAAYRDYVRGTKHAGGYAKSADSEEFLE